jgi:4-amino-4-deoxy-L-arabinose transferase-like glycosyltransferase
MTVLVERAPDQDVGHPAFGTWVDGRRGAAGLVGAVTVAYTALTVRWVVAPIGLSHEGRNTAMFALAARAMSRLGLTGSRAGSVLADGNGYYAHHPPMLVWALYLSRALFGSHPWSDRLPTFLASLAVIWLLFGLLGDLGLRPLAAAIGTTMAVANPMFLLYLWMADTPMWSLPFALLATRCWVRLRAADQKNRGRDTVLLTVAVVLCALSGWQAVMWCGLLALAAWRHGRRLSLRMMAALGIGLVVSVAWITLSPAGIHGLVDAFDGRAGGLGQDLPLPNALANNWTYLLDLWSPIVLVAGPFALWWAWRDQRVRRVLMVALVGVVGYGALFWEAAGFHDYWNSWGVVIVALGFGAGADAVLSRSGHQDPARVPRLAAVLAGVAVLAFAIAPLQHTDTEAHLTEGIALSRAIAATPLPADQPAWLLSALSGSETWISYDSDRPVRRVSTRAGLLRLADQHPDWVMVVPCVLNGHDRCAQLAVGGHVVNGVAVNRLSRIVANLPG